MAHDGCNFTSSNPNPEPNTDTNPHDTLPYFIIPYSIILHSIIPYSMIQHSRTIVVGDLMQIALRPLFDHENTVTIFYCTNIIIICPEPPHNEISGLSPQSTTYISASLWTLKLYIDKFSAPNLWQCSMSEESKKEGWLLCAVSIMIFLLVNYLIGSHFPRPSIFYHPWPP